MPAPIRRPFKEVEAGRPDFDEAAHVEVTKVPNPDFRPGDGLNSLPNAKEFEPSNAVWRSIDPAEHDKPTLYKLMISGVTPRPIALMSTVGLDGRTNLAPMSYFNMVSHNPPTIMISIQSNPKERDGLKDTTRNIKETNEFCCSIISEPFLEAANYTSIDSPCGVDEWVLSGLTKRASETVRPPHVAESAFSMECSLVHSYDVCTDDGVLSNTVVFGRIKRFQAAKFVFDPEDGMKILPDKLRSISRLGGVTFGRTMQMSELPRPFWEQVKDTDDVRKALLRAA